MRLRCALALACALAGCSKSASTTASHGPSAGARTIANNPASASDGALVYIANCSSCHQANGRGVPGAFPPLSGDPVVDGDSAKVIQIVKYGSSGRIVVNAATYDGKMPQWEGLISDDDIAAVVTYIRSSWHNHAGAVSVAGVRAVTK